MVSSNALMSRSSRVSSEPVSIIRLLLDWGDIEEGVGYGADSKRIPPLVADVTAGSLRLAYEFANSMCLCRVAGQGEMI
jgi:hypothetical protein